MFGKKRPPMLEAGARAPAFELKDLSGAPQRLEIILENGPAVLAFFKIGCPVCQMTFPYLERLAGQSALQFIGISQDEPKATRGFNERFRITFPTLVDNAAQGYVVSNAYGISSVPSIFVVERDGAISKSFSGFSKRDLEALGERIGKPPFAPGEKVADFRPG